MREVAFNFVFMETDCVLKVLEIGFDFKQYGLK